MLSNLAKFLFMRQKGKKEHRQTPTETSDASLNSFENFAQWMEPEELRERVKSLWSAVAIIAALVATISFSNFASVGTSIKSDIGGDLFLILNFMSGWSCFTSAFVITACWTALEETPLDKTREFFVKFGWLVNVPNMLLTVGGTTMALSYLILAYNYNTVVLIVCVLIFVAGACTIRITKIKLHSALKEFNSSMRVENAGKVCPVDEESVESGLPRAGAERKGEV